MTDAPLPGDPSEPVVVYRTTAQRKAREFALVLAALGIAHRIEQAGPELSVLVAARDRERSLREFAFYVLENENWPPRDEPVALLGRGPGAALIYCIVLVLAFRVQLATKLGAAFEAAGRVEADKVISGELYRAVTALTLHADVRHLFSNLFFGALLVGGLSQAVGAGAGLLAALLAGALGNLLDAWIARPWAALGASTAVFGALGALLAVRFRQGGGTRIKRYTPVVLGLALFGMSGLSQEPHVDVAAHVFGLLAGGGIGLVLAALPRARLESDRLQVLAGAGAALALALCWLAALT